MVYVPSAALLTVDSPIVRRLKLPHSCTVHGRLAAALTAIFKTPNSELEPWRATWPSVRDFQQSMPLLWDDQLREILPWRTKGTPSPVHSGDQHVTFAPHAFTIIISGNVTTRSSAYRRLANVPSRD